MTWQDEQKQVATGVTDGTDGREYSKVFPYEPMQQPVAWRHDMGEENGGWEYFEHASCPDCQPLYTAPPRRNRVDDDDDIQEYKRPWVGLTDAEILRELERVDPQTKRLPAGLKIFASYLEARLKEKNA